MVIKSEYVNQSGSKKQAYDLANNDYRNDSISKSDYNEVIAYIKSKPDSAFKNKRLFPKGFKSKGKTNAEQVAEVNKYDAKRKQKLGRRTAKSGTKKSGSQKTGKKFYAGLSRKEFNAGMARLMKAGMSKDKAFSQMQTVSKDPERIHGFRKTQARQNGLSKSAFRWGMAKLMKAGDSKETAYKKMSDIAAANRKRRGV